MSSKKTEKTHLDMTWRLILLTLTVSILVAVADSALSGLGWTRRYAVLNELWLSGELAMLARKPWTLVSYMFVHNNMWHLAINLLLLFVFGKLFHSLLGARRLLAIYLLGGVVAGFFYPLLFFSLDMLGVNLLRLPLLGASGALMALLLAVGCYAPHYRVMLMGRKIPIVFLSVFFSVCFLIFAGTDNVGGLAAHGGGLLVGLAFALLLRYREVDITQPFHGQKGAREEAIATQAELTRARKEKRIAEIIQKIKSSGYAALSGEERRFMFGKSSSKDESKDKLDL